MSCPKCDAMKQWIVPTFYPPTHYTDYPQGKCVYCGELGADKKIEISTGSLYAPNEVGNDLRNSEFKDGVPVDGWVMWRHDKCGSGKPIEVHLSRWCRFKKWLIGK